MKECKLCRTVMDAETRECPNCGCDPETGMLAGAAARGFRREVALRAEDRHWSQRGLCPTTAPAV